MTGTLLILGDSISLGAAEVRGNDVLDTVSQSYVDILRGESTSTHLILDADVHRTTTAGRAALPALLGRHEPSAVLLMLGGNDADLDWKRFVLSGGQVIRNRVPVATYQLNLRIMATTVLAAGAVPVLTDLPNHHFELRGPYVSKLAGQDVCEMLDRRGGQDASDKLLATYRHAVAEVAAELRVPLVQYGRVLDARPARDMVGIDGVHPSAAAHRLIADTLLPILPGMLSRATRVEPAVPA